MDLRPINPFYQKSKLRTTRALISQYSYPYAWIPPVTDRTREDVEYVKYLNTKGWDNLSEEERASYMAGLKGCLNISDLERIENNIQILLDVLEIDSASNIGQIPEFPTDSYFALMKSNLEAIRGAYAVHDTTPRVPDLPYNTWQAYNDIEQILHDVHEVLEAQFYYFTGSELYLGDDTGLVL